MKMNFKIVFKAALWHGKILFRGVAKTLYGAATAGLIALAVKGFSAVTSADGYVAVCDFILAAATMAVGISFTYAFGTRKKKGRFSPKG